MAAESCAGCGIYAENHPIVGVMHDGDTDARVTVPVCKDCHEDPAHRTKSTLKCHFYQAGDDAVRGLRMSKHLLNESKAGRDLGIGG